MSYSGEYGIGMMANNLALGCDCVGQIHYLASHLVTISDLFSLFHVAFIAWILCYP
jgi:Cu2+-containing amine oxidase